MGRPFLSVVGICTASDTLGRPDAGIWLSAYVIGLCFSAVERIFLNVGKSRRQDERFSPCFERFRPAVRGCVRVINSLAGGFFLSGDRFCGRSWNFLYSRLADGPAGPLRPSWSDDRGF
jgi:hypothetical protein